MLSSPKLASELLVWAVAFLIYLGMRTPPCASRHLDLERSIGRIDKLLRWISGPKLQRFLCLFRWNSRLFPQVSSHRTRHLQDGRIAADSFSMWSAAA